MSAKAPFETSAIRAMLGILAAQLLIAVLVAVTGGLTAGKVAALSALLGGMICVLPNVFLALRIVVAGIGNDPQKLVRGLYFAEAGKLAISVLLFVAVFSIVKPLSPLWLFGGFIATTLVMWLALRFDTTGFEDQG